MLKSGDFVLVMIFIFGTCRINVESTQHEKSIQINNVVKNYVHLW